MPLVGKSILYIGDKREPYEMEIGKVYNVKLGVWHTITMKEGTKALIVENDDTGKAENNTNEFFGTGFIIFEK